MIESLITTLMLFVAAIHLLPLAGFVGPKQLLALYGMEVDSPDLEILMRHRAVLFGILGGFFAVAAFERSFQPIAFIAAAVSLGSFFFLASSVRGFGPGIRKIVIGDVIAAVCLAGAVVLYLIES